MAAKKPNEGPPKSSRLPSGWPSPTATSNAALARGAQDAEGDRVDRRRRRGRPPRAPARRERLQILDRAEEVRVLDEDGGGVRSSRAPASSPASVSPPSSPHLDDLGAEAPRVGRERLAAVRVQAARDDQLAPALLRAERQVGGGRDRGWALVQRGVGDRQPGQLGDRGLELEHHLEAALGDLWLVRRVRRQELGALSDRVRRSPGRSGRTCRRRGSRSRRPRRRCARRGGQVVEDTRSP